MQLFPSSSKSRIRGEALELPLGRRSYTLHGMKNIVMQNMTRLWSVGPCLGMESCFTSSHRAFPEPRPQNCLSDVSGPAWLFARAQGPWASRPSSFLFSCLLRALLLTWLSSSLCPGVRAAKLASPGSMLCPEDPHPALPSSQC